MCGAGDAFKLYERFTTDENNGVAGAFITLIVYLAEFLVAGFCLYNYLIYIHMNGEQHQQHCHLPPAGSTTDTSLRGWSSASRPARS